MKTFTPNFIAPKRKSHIRHEVDIYAYSLPDVTYDPSTHCNAQHKHSLFADQDAGYYICSHCHQIVDNIYINDSKDDKVKQSQIVIWSRDYDRNRWKNYGLDYMTGSNNLKISEQAWYDVLQTIPTTFTWYDVYKKFQAQDLLAYWPAFSSYVGLPISITTDVMIKVDQYIDYCSTNYRVPYQYLMYKFSQLLHPGSEKYVPLARSKAWIKKTDQWWQTICEEEKLDYQPTQIHKIEWPKEKVLKQLAVHMKKAGLKKQVRTLIGNDIPLSYRPKEDYDSSCFVRKRLLASSKLSTGIAETWFETEEKSA